MSTDKNRKRGSKEEKGAPPKYARPAPSESLSGEAASGVGVPQQDAIEASAVAGEAVEAAPAPSPALPTSALFVTHGMGEQLRFEPIDGIVSGLARVLPGTITREVHTVAVDDGPPIQRLQLTDGKRILHIYEAYWAPLTEGQVSLRDVVAFLWSAGWNGFTKGNKQFYRTIFQQKVEFPIPLVSNVLLIVAALAILSLVGVVVLATGVVLNGLISVEDQSSRDAMTVIGIFVQHVVMFGLLLIAARAAKPVRGSSLFHRSIARFFGALATLALYTVIALLLLSAWAIVVILASGKAGSSTVVTDWLAQVHPAMWVAAVALALAAFMELFFDNRPESIRFLALVMRWVSLVVPIVVVVALIFTSSVKLYREVQLKFDERAQLDSTPELSVNGDHEHRRSLWVTMFKKPTFARALGRWPYSGSSIWPFATFVVAGLLLMTGRRRSTACRRRRPKQLKYSRWTEPLAFVLAITSLPLLAFWTTYYTVGGLERTEFVPMFMLMVPWVLVVVVGYFVRDFLVGHLGDVAAYVNSHKLDKFFKIKAEIRALAFSVARTLYRSKSNQNKPLYEKVGFVSHSLGSVVAFDVLNRMLIEEQLDLKLPSSKRIKYEVRTRTNLFITSGSPLDKIAYVCSAASASAGSAMDELSAAAQPLISDSAFRMRLKWLNFWTPNDVISGPLEFYDLRGQSAVPKVKNIEDKYATTPLAAHGEYFAHNDIFDRINAWW